MEVKAENPQLFGIDTNEKIPECYFYSNRAWDDYMGRLWSSVLELTNIGADQTVIEVAPGASVKIPVALATRGFKGHLFVVDPSSKALAEAKGHYLQLLPGAKITFLAKSLQESLAELPRKPACILSNHPLDDMILAAGKKPGPINELFGWSCIDEITISLLLKKAWEDIIQSPRRLAEIKNGILDEWADTIGELKPQWVAISQYKSSTLQQSSMAALNDHAVELRENLRSRYVASAVEARPLQERFNNYKHYNNAHIGGEILNAANWLLLKSP